MSEIESTRSVYNAARRVLRCFATIDGVEHRTDCRNTPTDGQGDLSHAELLALMATRKLTELVDVDANGHVEAGDDWDGLPTGTDDERTRKQKIAQRTIRKAAENARLGAEAAQNPAARGEAIGRYILARDQLASVVEHATGTPAQKRAYLALSADEWTAVTGFYANIQSYSAQFAGVLEYLAQAPDLREIDTEESV